MGRASPLRPGAMRRKRGSAPRAPAGRQLRTESSDTRCPRRASTAACTSATDRTQSAPASIWTTALWTTQLPSRFVLGTAAIGLLRRVLVPSGAHSRTAPRSISWFESCPLKCMRKALETGGFFVGRTRCAESPYLFASLSRENNAHRGAHFWRALPVSVQAYRGSRAIRVPPLDEEVAFRWAGATRFVPRDGPAPRARRRADPARRGSERRSGPAIPPPTPDRRAQAPPAHPSVTLYRERNKRGADVENHHRRCA
jgi:hypothetical protein